MTTHPAVTLNERFRLHGVDPADLAACADEAILRLNAARPSWHDAAACRGSSLDFTTRSPAIRSRCVQVCGTCSVMLTCRDWADDIGDDTSVLGGEDAPARRHRWRQTGIVPPETLAGPTTGAFSAPRDHGTPPQSPHTHTAAADGV